MPELERIEVEQLLLQLEEKAFLFPQFQLKKEQKGLVLLGEGGFSYLYEMSSITRPDSEYVVKVIGCKRHTMASAQFYGTGRIQRILSQDCPYIMRILDERELLLQTDAVLQIVKLEERKESDSEHTAEGLLLQLVLMEKLCPIIKSDKFHKVNLCVRGLQKQEQILTFALEIGQAIYKAHSYQCLHRDIKLENIFFDEKEKVFKLGDFGIARYVGEGKADTLVYTDGYGAPEIEKRRYSSYDATADIYSFGITLYLLFNELRFPGSSGYYPKVEVQYSPDFVFPAPVNASEEVARIIRKMCAFEPKDRYQTIGQVLLDLRQVLEKEVKEPADELLELMDLATETYHEESMQNELQLSGVGRGQTREERKADQAIWKWMYWEDTFKYFLGFMVFSFLLHQSVYGRVEGPIGWIWGLSFAALVVGFFRYIRELQIITALSLLAGIVFFSYSQGINTVLILGLISLILPYPVLLLAWGTGGVLWAILHTFWEVKGFAFLEKIPIRLGIFLAWFILLFFYRNMQKLWSEE